MSTSIREKILSGLNKEKKEIYTFKEMLNITGVENENTVRRIIARIVKDKRLVSLRQGLYLYVPEGYENSWTASNFWIGANLVEPYAISFWSALNHWGLTEQLPNKTYIETIKVVKNLNRTILNNEYQIITLAEKRFFGITQIWVSNHQVNITDQEKTLADCLAFPQHCGGISEISKGIYNFYQANQPENLVSYAQRMGQPALKRLGYLLKTLGVGSEEEINRIKKLITNPNPITLEPLLPSEKSDWNSKWKLNINISKEDLLSWKAK